jgi:alcohol dehydrogenase
VVAANFNFPTNIRFGAGRVKDLPALSREAGMAAPLLVTDPALAEMAMTKEVVSDLAAAGLKVKVFCDVRSNPVAGNVEAGVKTYRSGRHDGVIAFGGGSALDVGKVVAFMQGQSRPMFDFEDIGDWWTRANARAIAPVIAVPTTAGTGSEVGRAGVITQPDSHEKKVIFHPAMMPRFAVLDPELTVGLPAKLTAATGMDALAHNLEAYCSPFWHPLAKGVALEGMRLVKENLPEAVHQPGDLEARGAMLVASAMGATAFQGGLGAIHALSHPLGGLYDSHHGLLNGIIMPYVVAANRKKIEPEIERAAAYLGIRGRFDGFVNWILKLRRAIGIPNSLSEIGIDGKRVAEVAAMAVKDPTHGGNPISFSERQYQALLRRAIRGEL